MNTPPMQLQKLKKYVQCIYCVLAFLFIMTIVIIFKTSNALSSNNISNNQTDDESSTRLVIITKSFPNTNLRNNIANALKAAFENDPRFNFHVTIDEEYDPNNIDYSLYISVKVVNTLLEANIELFIEPSHKQIFEFKEEKVQDGIESLVMSIASTSIIKIEMNIRIVILDFLMLGGDSNLYGQLKRKLPNMLTSSLNVSPKLVLLVGKIGEEEIDKTLSKGSDESLIKYNRSTALSQGERMYANYLIMGEFGEIAGELHIYVECVNVETGEIVVSRGIPISKITFNTIQKNMERLGAEMRAAIEKDYTVRKKGQKYFGLSGFPPIPNTKENRYTLYAIIKTTSRKLNHHGQAEFGHPRR